uniref:Uncharacterized protein n=1 Tax=Peronospora matthiolae TaxID=2874970 RepID=A0AAV1VAK5_9STRA
METVMNPSEALHITFEKLTTFFGHEKVALIVTQGPDALRASLEASNFNSTLIGQVHYLLASAIPTRYVAIQTLDQELIL